MLPNSIFFSECYSCYVWTLDRSHNVSRWLWAPIWCTGWSGQVVGIDLAFYGFQSPCYCFKSTRVRWLQSCLHSHFLKYTLKHIYIYILHTCNYTYGCKSNYRVRNKVRDHTRSIPPFHTSVPYLFEGSVPYLCSIPLIHTLWYIYKLYLTICNIYIYIWTCAIWFYICTHMHERTYIHECIHARIRLLCPSPVIVLASLCLQHLQLLPTLLRDGRGVLGCCQLAV